MFLMDKLRPLQLRLILKEIWQYRSQNNKILAETSVNLACLIITQIVSIWNIKILCYHASYALFFSGEWHGGKQWSWCSRRNDSIGFPWARFNIRWPCAFGTRFVCANFHSWETSLDSIICLSAMFNVNSSDRMGQKPSDLSTRTFTPDKPVPDKNLTPVSRVWYIVRLHTKLRLIKFDVGSDNSPVIFELGVANF